MYNMFILSMLESMDCYCTLPVASIQFEILFLKYLYLKQYYKKEDSSPFNHFMFSQYISFEILHKKYKLQIKMNKPVKLIIKLFQVIITICVT